MVSVDKTKVLIKIQLDKNKHNAGNYWFDFATVYSTPDGTGWYYMSEIDDEVRLIFPDKCEGNAYVASCVHTECDNRTNPDEKSWKKAGKGNNIYTRDTFT